MKTALEFIWSIRYVPEIEQAGRFAMPQQQFNITYRHDTWALHLHDYPGVMDLAGRRYALKSGDLTFSPPGMASSYEIKMPGRHWCIHFRPHPAADPTLGLPLYLALAGRKAYLTEQFSRIAQGHVRGGGHDTESPLRQAEAALALQELLIWLAGDGCEPNGSVVVCSSSSKVDSLAADICQRLDENLSVTALCRRAGLSRNYMSRQFRRRHGMTIAHYILVQRLHYARSLLEGTDMQIKTIGITAGMPDPRHFNKQFRRFYGAAPSSIRFAAVEQFRKTARRAGRLTVPR